MRAGLLDRRISIESYTKSRNSFGDTVLTWSELRGCWANYVQKKGKEVDTDKNLNHDVTILFYTRWFSDVTEDMRIVYKSKYYKIEEIKEMGREDGLAITVSLLHQT